jgi:hypothetical protein
MPEPKAMTSAPAASETLSARQQAIVPIAAFAAAGDITRLGAALNQGLDTGLTVSDAKECSCRYAARLSAQPQCACRADECWRRASSGHSGCAGASTSRAIQKGDACSLQAPPTRRSWWAPVRGRCTSSRGIDGSPRRIFRRHLRARHVDCRAASWRR